MKLEFTKYVGTPRITDTYHIYVDIKAIEKHAQKIAYAVQNMAYSLGYKMTKKEATP